MELQTTRQVVARGFVMSTRSWYRLMSDGALEAKSYHQPQLGWVKVRQVNPKGTAFSGLIWELRSRYQGQVPVPEQLDDTTPWCGCHTPGSTKCKHGRYSWQSILRGTAQ